MSSKMSADCESKLHASVTSNSVDDNYGDEKKCEYLPHQNFVTVKYVSDCAETVHYSMFCSDLPDDMIKEAMKRVKETEEKRVQGIQKLKEFIKKKGLRCLDDDSLISVLRICKYNIKKSESKLEIFLKYRQMVGLKLATVDKKELEDIMDMLPTCIFPYRDRYGRVLFISKPVPKLETLNVETTLLLARMMLLYILYTPMTSLLGATYIGNADLSSMRGWYKVLMVFRHLALDLRNFPLSLKKIDVVKENFLCRWMYNTIRPILPAKIVNRVSFLGDYENLQKFYHPDILPKEFGGNLGPINDKLYRKQLLEFAEKLEAESKYDIH